MESIATSESILSIEPIKSHTLYNDNIDIAEEQYFKQRKYEIKLDNPNEAYSANFPCFWGEAFVNSNTFEIDGPKVDGGKWVCGVHYLQEPCIVYSFGCKNNFKFEYGIYELTKGKCKIYVFDPFTFPTNITFIETDLLQRNIFFYKWGVSNTDDVDHNKQFYKLSTIMKMLNHSFIDILKVDVEGSEYPMFHVLDKNNDWPSIGQIQVEIHTNPASVNKFNDSFGLNQSIDVTPRNMIHTLVTLFESYNMRLFHKEINMFHLYNTILCTEYAFIQKDWKPHIKNYRSI